MKRQFQLVVLGFVVAAAFLGSTASCRHVQSQATASPVIPKVKAALHSTSVKRREKGLADSPWPKFRGDAQNTGRSRYVGAQTGELKWWTTIGHGNISSASIGLDGTIYMSADREGLVAVKPEDGSIKWAHKLHRRSVSTPAVGADGTVYVGDGTPNETDGGALYAIDPRDGSEKWVNGIGEGVASSPTVGPDNTVYVGGKAVVATNGADGTTKWEYWDEHYSPIGASSPALGLDGTVYVLLSDGVYALNGHDGTVRWRFETASLANSSPAVSDRGFVYVGDDGGKTYSLSVIDGAVKWVYDSGGTSFSSPAVGVDGTVYVSDTEKVIALNPDDGSVRWKQAIAGGGRHTSPAVDANGTIYVAGWVNICALRPKDGSLVWGLYTPGFVRGSPAIGADGTIYVTGSNPSGVYAIGP